MSFQQSHLPIQKYLWDYARDNKNINLLLALLISSRMNKDITLTDFGMNGKLRQLKVNYLAPICDDGGDCDDTVCDAGRVVEPSQFYFNLTQCTAGDVYEFGIDDIRELDGNITFSDWALMVIRNAMPQVRERLHSAVAAQMVGEAGYIPLSDGTGVEELLINWVNPATGMLNPQGYNQMARAFADGGFSSNPFIVGGPTVDDFERNMRIASVNEYGQNLAALQTSPNIWYDPIVPATFADPTRDHILAWDPEVLKFVNFSYNAGIFATDMNGPEDLNRLFWQSRGGRIFGTYYDNRTGLLWDFNALIVDCPTPVWRFQWRIHWDIVFLPPRQCNLQGVNGIFHFEACLAPAVECPTPAALSPISGDTEFSFDTSGEITYEYFIQQLQTGNQLNTYDGLNQVDTVEQLQTMLNDHLAPYGIVLSLAGTTLSYTGSSAITININGGTANGGLTFTFS